MKKSFFQKCSSTYSAGIIITVLFSAIIGFFNIAVLYWFGIPIFALFAGIILIWFSQKNLKIKIISTILPIPIIIFSFFLFYLLLPKAEPETFLIPQNFRGQLEIIFEEPCGQSLIYKNNHRIYKIPNSGILITNAKRTLGVIDRKFYLIEETGQRIELSEFHWSKFESEQKDWHWMFSKTKLSKDLVGVFWAYSNEYSFIISDYQNLENQDKETGDKIRQQFSENAAMLLKQCRASR